MTRSRFRPLGAALTALTTLLGVGLVTGLVAGPASAVQVQHSNPAGKGVTRPRPAGQASPTVGSASINHGGPVQTAPRVYLDFWGWNNQNNVGAYLQDFLSKVAGTPWLDTVTQYSGAGAVAPLVGTWLDAATVPQVPTDADIQTEASAAVAHFGLSTSDLNVQIVVATPSGHSTAGFGTNYCAYHGVIGSTSNTYTNLPYIPDAGAACGAGSVNPNGVLDGVSIVEGHELAETITDPLLNAWFDPNGNEIADSCAWTNLGNLDLNGTNFAMQPLWSNATNSCVTGTVASTLPATPGDERLKGDFTGDGKSDIAVLYDLAPQQSRLYELTSTGTAFAAPAIWFDGGAFANWDWTRSKAVAADFNGDGKSDVGILYDSGNGGTSFWVLLSTGSSFLAPRLWYDSGAGNWNWSLSKPVAGDFTGDGKADIGVLYDAGNVATNMYVLASSGSTFSIPQLWYASGPNNWGWNVSKPISGDFNGDGKTDLGVIYNYPNTTTGFNVMLSTGSSFVFGAKKAWYLASNWDWNVTMPVAGDFTGDGKDDIGVLYGAGNIATNMYVLISSGSAFGAPQLWYASGPNNWAWGASKAVAGDFTGDHKADIGVVYNYPNSTTGFLVMTAPNSTFNRKMFYLDNNWDWYRSMPA